MLMNVVTFIVALVFSLIAAIVSGYALVQLHRNNQKARSTLVAGFGFWLAGIVISSILFGFFSL
jgi:predicted Co/Zn/Cd cation transporter (cation efflux family)